MSAPLVLRNFSGVIEVSPDALALKAEALAAAKPVVKVENPEEQTVAVKAMRSLKEIRAGMEATRKSVKAPVLELGRKIDAVASEFMSDVSSEEMRLQGLVNHYQRKQMEASRAEQVQLTQRAKQADELNIEAQELRHNAVFERDNDTKRAMLQRAEEIEKQALDAVLTNELTDTLAVNKAPGLVVKNRINFQVTDPIVFAQAWPDFWKWHAETETLKVDRQRILDELNRENGDGVFHKTKFPEELSNTEDRRLVRPAGLRVYEETKSHVR